MTTQTKLIAKAMLHLCRAVRYIADGSESHGLVVDEIRKAERTAVLVLDGIGEP